MPIALNMWRDASRRGPRHEAGPDLRPEAVAEDVGRARLVVLPNREGGM